MKARDAVPVIREFEDFEQLEEIWQEVYESRSKKVGRKRAIYSANATVFSECLKSFLEADGDVYKKWINKISGPNTRELKEAKQDYKTYIVEGIEVIITSKRKVLDDYPNAERKGTIKEMDEFEYQILQRIVEDNDIKIHPSLYFVINGENNG